MARRLGDYCFTKTAFFKYRRRCRYLLSALGDAVLTHRFSHPQQADKVNLGPLDEYTLEQSSSRGVDGIALGSKIEFHQWLQYVLKGDFFPTFYFPSNIAGPDLVFCLRHQQNRNKRLICAIQVNELQLTYFSLKSVPCLELESSKREQQRSRAKTHLNSSELWIPTSGLKESITNSANVSSKSFRPIDQIFRF